MVNLAPRLSSEAFWCFGRGSQHPWLDRRGAPWHGPHSWQSSWERNPLSPRRPGLRCLLLLLCVLCSELGWGYYSSKASEISKRGVGGGGAGSEVRSFAVRRHQRLMVGFSLEPALNRKLVWKERRGLCVFLFLKTECAVILNLESCPEYELSVVQSWPKLREPSGRESIFLFTLSGSLTWKWPLYW